MGMNVKGLFAKYKVQQLKNRMDTVELAFPDSLQQPKSILVCLPGGLRELTLVKQFLPTISEMYRSAKITLLALPGIKVHDIYPHKGFQIVSPTAEQLTWSGLPKKSFVKTLQDNNFEMVIDLNLEQSAFTSSVLLNFPQAVRIGRGNHRGQPFYNLEIKTRYLRDERNIYRSMFDMIEILRQSRN